MSKLHDAIDAENFELVKDLLESEGGRHEITECGLKLLELACATGSRPIVEVLIEKVDCFGYDGSKALELTTDDYILQLLFDHGATRELSYYDKYRYCANYEEIYEFRQDLKDDVVSKLRAKYNLELCEVDSHEIEEGEEGKALFWLNLIGVVSIKNGCATYAEIRGCTYDLNELLELCGYKVQYEGSTSSGRPGIYFV